MINNKLSSKKAILGIVVLFVIAIVTILYFSSSKKSPEAIPQTQTNQATTNTTPAPADNATPNPDTSAPSSAPSQDVPKHDGWKTSSKNNIVFQYPEELGTQYMDTNKWPPEVKVNAGEYSCVQLQNEEGGPTETVLQQVIDGRTYCAKTTSEGAAGSIYKTYTYTTSKNGKLIAINFILRYTNCDVYNNDTDLEQKQYKECNKEEESFDVDSLVDQIVQTVQLGK